MPAVVERGGVLRGSGASFCGRDEGIKLREPGVTQPP